MSGISVNESTSQLNSLQMQSRALGKNPPPKPDMEEMLNKLSEDLNLTSEQKTKLSDILKEEMSGIDSEKNGSSSKTAFDPEKMKTKMDELDTKIKSILNDDQIAEFEKLTENRKLDHQQKSESFQNSLDRKNENISRSALSETDSNNVDIYI